MITRLMSRLSIVAAFQVLVTFFATGCAIQTPATQGELARGSGIYVPIDPLPVKLPPEYAKAAEDPAEAVRNKKFLVGQCPDSTMRMGFRKIGGAAAGSYGTGKAKTEHNTYEVVVDYMRYTTRALAFKREETASQNPQEMPKVTFIWISDEKDLPTATHYVPVYIGVGARLSATIYSTSGELDSGQLFNFGMSASANHAEGTLVVQGLGLSGEKVEAAIPIPGEINRTTVQNGLLALGTMKAKMYDDSVGAIPRAVGFYNTLSNDPATTNTVISALLAAPIDLKSEGKILLRTKTSNTSPSPSGQGIAKEATNAAPSDNSK